MKGKRENYSRLLDNGSVGKVINTIGPSTFILESPGGKKSVSLEDFPKIDIKLSRLPRL